MSAPTIVLDGQEARDAQAAPAVEDAPSRPGQRRRDPQTSIAGAGPNIRHDQSARDIQSLAVVADPIPEPAMRGSMPTKDTPARDQNGSGQVPLDAQSAYAAASDQPAPAMPPATPRLRTLGLADPILTLAADVLDDLERVRIGNENRLRQLTRVVLDKDGGERGFGLDESHPDVARLAALVEALKHAEHQAELNLGRMMRRHPLGPWIKATVGVGEKQGARLLAAISDPYLRPELVRGDGTVEPERPRRVGELWAYAGYHVVPDGHGPTETHSRRVGGDPSSARQTDHETHVTIAGGDGGDPDQTAGDAPTASVGVAASRRRGQRANWSPTAKMRAHLIAESCIKQSTSPYRQVYDDGREKYAEATHRVPCARCGPQGHPAAPGSPLSAGHQHARALRLVAKALLKDLWREAKGLHDQDPRGRHHPG